MMGKNMRSPGVAVRMLLLVLLCSQISSSRAVRAGEMTGQEGVAQDVDRKVINQETSALRSLLQDAKKDETATPPATPAKDETATDKDAEDTKNKETEENQDSDADASGKDASVDEEEDGFSDADLEAAQAKIDAILDAAGQQMDAIFEKGGLDPESYNEAAGQGSIVAALMISGVALLLQIIM